MSAAVTGRDPSQAGLFYPADPRRLRRLVDELLDHAPAPPIPLASERLVGILVPHAGLHYSGGIAAAAWSLVRRDPPATIVLAGTNHFDAHGGVGVWTDGPWRGTLAEWAIDRGLASRLARLGPPFRVELGAHLGEHSLEVQLPFLARVAPDARLVPLLVGPADPETCRWAGSEAGRQLEALHAAGERILLVASSDLAHYPDEALARRLDRRSLEAIEALDMEGLVAAEADARQQVACGLCGLDPVLFTLAALTELGVSHGVRLAEGTSADAPDGDRGRVVGYGSVAFMV